MRIIKTTGYDNEKYTDENTLFRAGLLSSNQLTNALTYLNGRNSNLFPILTATQGKGLIKTKQVKKLNGDTQYTWPIMGRIKLTSRLVRVVSTGNRIGYGQTPITLVFDDATFIHQWSILTPNGKKQVRLTTDGKKVAGGFEYTGVMLTPNSYLTAEDLVVGLAWGLNAPSVAASKSIGNRSNRTTPGEMTNQFGFHRFSKDIAGNVANKVVEFEFELEDGTKTNKWLPFEMNQFEIMKNIAVEQDLWLSEYNRDENGTIMTIDEETGEPIPKGAGIRQILKDMGYYDTYAYLNIRMIDTILTTIAMNNDDALGREIVVYGGAGGRREFHNMMMREAVNGNLHFKLSDVLIKPISNGMQYGEYFVQYKDINGRIISFIETDLFNKGSIAEQQKQNGHLIDGLPLVSYTMAFMNQGVNTEGESNIQLIAEEGRESIRRIYKGMSPIPAEWGPLSSSMEIADRRDIASYEVFESKGISILDASSCFYLEREL